MLPLWLFDSMMTLTYIETYTERLIYVKLLLNQARYRITNASELLCLMNGLGLRHFKAPLQLHYNLLLELSITLQQRSL